MSDTRFGFLAQFYVGYQVSRPNCEYGLDLEFLQNTSKMGATPLTRSHAPFEFSLRGAKEQGLQSTTQLVSNLQSIPMRHAGAIHDSRYTGDFRAHISSQRGRSLPPMHAASVATRIQCYHATPCFTRTPQLKNSWRCMPSNFAPKDSQRHSLGSKL